MRLNAFSAPPSSTTAIVNGLPSSAALASAAPMIRCAAADETLFFEKEGPRPVADGVPRAGVRWAMTGRQLTVRLAHRRH
jgi:hypothetical protein